MLCPRWNCDWPDSENKQPWNEEIDRSQLSHMTGWLICTTRRRLVLNETMAPNTRISSFPWRLCALCHSCFVALHALFVSPTEILHGLCSLVETSNRGSLLRCARASTELSISTSIHVLHQHVFPAEPLLLPNLWFSNCISIQSATIQLVLLWRHPFFFYYFLFCQCCPFFCFPFFLFFVFFFFQSSEQTPKLAKKSRNSCCKKGRFSSGKVWG